MKMVLWPALTPALSSRRGRIVRRRSSESAASYYSTAFAQVTNLEIGGEA